MGTSNLISASNSITIWQSWVQDTGTGGSLITSSPVTINSNVWVSWLANGTSVRIANNSFDRYRVEPSRELTAEEKIDRAWDEAKAENTARELRRVEMESRQRAELLLHQHLSDEQKAQLIKDKHFFVRSQSGKLYKVKTGKIHNIIMVDPVSKQELLEMCVTADQHHIYPDHDVMLAQKLLLEHQESDALLKANIWNLREGRRVLTPQEKARLVA